MNRCCIVAALCALAVPAFAQSPNTASLVVSVIDQTGAAVPGAQVSVVNTATGATRDVVSGAEGSATIAALSLSGTYKVSVTMPGFTADDVTGLTLRAGETATVKVKLVASGGQSEVTVYGTTQGVRADAQIGTPARQRDHRRNADPGAQSQFGAAAQLRVPLGQGHRRPLRQRHLFRHGRRQPAQPTTFTIDGVNNDEGWGRQTMMSTVPLGAVQEMTTLSNAFSAEFGWTAGPAVSIVTKSGTNACTAKDCSWLAPPAGRRRHSGPMVSARRPSRRA